MPWPQGSPGIRDQASLRFLTPTPRPRRAWIAALGALVLVSACAPRPQPSLIGGAFRLVDQNGAAVDQTILEGKWSAVFFGYTFCPDVCPTTLTTLAQAIEKLGPRARRLQVLFISIDPGRDTPAQLKSYLSSPAFPKGTIGLTGTPQEIARVARAYRVYFKKVGDGPNYSVDHTSIVYLMDPQGRFSEPVDFGGTPDQVARQIAKAMNGT
jgi:protein SCO1/2